MKAFLKRLVERTGYRVVRATGRNRFNAQQECLQSLARRGYAPRRIVDGGVNVGDFARLSARIFPAGRIDLVEPQPGCAQPLRALAAGDGRFVHHACALGSAPGTLEMVFDPAQASTGAHVVPDGSAAAQAQRVPVTTLDALLAGCQRSDRVFLKLDLQGWELEALKGGEQALTAIECILTEASFYVQAYEPPLASLIDFLARRGFVLHDVAALTARARDNRAHQADLLFVRHDSPLNQDNAWS